MKKYMSMLLLMVATASAGYAQDCRPVQFCPQPATPCAVSCPVSYPCPAPCASPCAPFGKYQIGIAFEENLARGDAYGYLSGTIKDRFYFELRGYGIWNYITATPPTGGFPVITPPINNREQKNVYGTGFVGIFGYTFKLPCGMKGSLTPYFRYEARSNVYGPQYKDRRGNEITTWGYGYLGGLRFNMPVTEDFSWAIQYWGGFVRTDLRGKGFFAQGTTNILPRPSFRRSHFNLLQGNFQFSLAYNLNKCWSVAAWWQITLTDNNPGARITDAPSPYSGRITRLTSASYLWGVKLGYNF